MQQQVLLRGAPPLAPARGFPNLPRFACADLRCASPFPLPLSLRFKGGGYPSPCACYPPPSPGGVRHVCHMPLPKSQKQRSHDNAVSSSAHSDSPRTSEPSCNDGEDREPPIYVPHRGEHRARASRPPRPVYLPLWRTKRRPHARPRDVFRVGNRERGSEAISPLLLQE